MTADSLKAGIHPCLIPPRHARGMTANVPPSVSGHWRSAPGPASRWSRGLNWGRPRRLGKHSLAGLMRRGSCSIPELPRAPSRVPICSPTSHGSAASLRKHAFGKSRITVAPPQWCIGSTPAPFDPEKLLATLAAHRVDLVLIGALAARLQGLPRLTAGANLTPERSPANLERLSTALRILAARAVTESVPEGLPFDCSATILARAELWNLVSSVGRIDLICRPAGTDGYGDLRSSAVESELHGTPLFAASLREMLRSTLASDRPQDRQDLMVIRKMLAADEFAEGGRAP